MNHFYQCLYPSSVGDWFISGNKISECNSRLREFNQWVAWTEINNLTKNVCLLTDECSLNNGGCSNHCSVVPGKGIVCSCPEGHQLKKDNRTCEIVDYCSSHLRCSQVCEQHKHMVKCSCYEGWALDTDGESCISVGE